MAGKAKPKPSVQVKGSDGEWRDLDYQRPMSEDPEINELWDMPIADLETIVDDEAHPLHEKALAVTAQVFAPIQQALVEWKKTQDEAFAPIADALRKHAGSISQSWISDQVSEYPGWRLFRDSLPQSSMPLVAGSIDFDSPNPPEASVLQVAGAAEDIGDALLRDLVAIQREALADARESSAEGLRVARSGRLASWWAAGAALAAAVIGAIGIMVAVVIGLVGILVSLANR